MSYIQRSFSRNANTNTSPFRQGDLSVYWLKSFHSSIRPFGNNSANRSHDLSHIRLIVKIGKNLASNQLVDFWTIFG
jgi:hypothetical protein